KPKAKVTIKPVQHVFSGDTVTLRCDIYDEGVTRWRYSWYKEGLIGVFSELQEHTFSLTQMWYTVSSAALNHTGVYVCRAERGKPAYNTQYSNTQLIWVTGVSPPVSLIISPNRTQHFTYDSVSLSCEDQRDSTGWRVSRYMDRWGLEDCSSSESGSQTGSTCTIRCTIICDTGVYWCESESGEKYHPVNITVHSGVILESPVHPVTEGDTLTLHCLYQHTTPPNLRADFYKDESLIQSQTTEMIISTVSKSHEGFYYCKHPERGESPKSWISVTVFHSESQISVLHILSSVLAVSPYLLVTVVLIFKCCRMRVASVEEQETTI
ncbi:low affinity immunoglobulin gamma Fc region receptor III-A-like, partial [Labeo rohita]|uniref:low affinity immunoglobulin gamma Fc region receptor III-A-like n=1 Tax=Labeo rohita TaxID=84645 RepID=UPI0021E1F953